MDDKLTIIRLSDAEAGLFMQFQKHYLLVKLLESVGAFDVKGGSVTIHFDATGGVGSVDVQRHFRLP